MSFIKISVRNMQALMTFLKRAPDAWRPIALEEFTKYVVGNESATHGLRYYPPYKSPTYVRTYTLQKNWTYNVESTKAYIENQTPYAQYPMGDPPTQAMRRIGWKGALERIMSNMTGGIRAASQAIDRWIKANLP